MAGDVPDRVIAPLLEESLQDLYEHAPCGYLSALPDGPIVRVNQTFLDWTGYKREDLVGARRFEDLLTPGGRIYHETHYAPLLRMQGTVREIALQMLRADGSRMPVLVNSTLRTSEAGSVVRTTVFDASDRRSYERELLDARRRESEARQRTERLQALTEVLAASLDPKTVATAALETAMTALGAQGGAVEAGGTGGGRLAAEGTLPGEHVEAIDLPRSAGRLELHFAAPPDLAEPDREFLLATARQCGQALERAQLFAETQRSSRRAAFLADMAEALERTPELDERARRLIELVVPQLAEAARVEVADEDGEPVTLADAGSGGGATLELPLLARSRRLGTLVLQGFDVSEPGEAEFLGEVAARAALALENARLYEHERRVAGALQESMLTRELPGDHRFQVATHYQPSLQTMEVGGDWYDAFHLPGGRLAIVVGDVVGRGIEAASAMGQLRSAVRALALSAPDPSDVLLHLDDFVEQVEIARSATMVYADVDLGTGAVRYACAGHPPPILLTPGAEPELLWDGRSPPLGAFVGIGERSSARIELVPGARVLLYTDGLVERRGRSIDAGIAALVEAVAARRDAPLPTLVERIPRLLLEPEQAPDDVCLLALGFGSTERFERIVEPDFMQLGPLRADLRVWLDAHGVEEADRNAVVLACSEAVGNAIEHGCRRRPDCCVTIGVTLEEGAVLARVEDDGEWKPAADDIDRGRGLVLIRHCMDEVELVSAKGTVVSMRRELGRGERG